MNRNKASTYPCEVMERQGKNRTDIGLRKDLLVIVFQLLHPCFKSHNKHLTLQFSSVGIPKKEDINEIGEEN